jgi:hypothetical protein
MHHGPKTIANQGGLIVEFGEVDHTFFLELARLALFGGG